VCILWSFSVLFLILCNFTCDFCVPKQHAARATMEWQILSSLCWRSLGAMMPDVRLCLQM
jgi:hypothetical protein